MAGDDVELLGTWGIGDRNDRGKMFARWILQNGLLVQSRMRGMDHPRDRWTCRRSMDGTLIQMDFILTSRHFHIVATSCDFSFPIGLDHRTVHCTLQIMVHKGIQLRRRSNCKGWRPALDQHGHPTVYQHCIRRLLTLNPVCSAGSLEKILATAASRHGCSARHRLWFVPSQQLKCLRSRRRRTQNPQMRKELSLQIRTCHRKELRQWKSERLSRFLAIPSRWKDLQHFLPKSAGRIDIVRPHENDFACMLAKFFNGPCELPLPPALFSEPIWTIQEMKAAIRRLKIGKGGDEVGLTAELLKHVPHEFLDALLRLYNDVLYAGEPPASWSKTLFTMLPKKLRAKQVTDFRPIANLRLLYKVFAYLLLGRLEHVLDAQQPEEQHGFRAGRRLEEHLLSANILLDKAQATGFPVWIISLDLSKAFDRAHWPALWAALLEQGVSQHLIWILQRVYYGQHGEIVGNFGPSDQFPITRGVRQGCVLSPRLFCAVLEFAMRKWRHAVGQAGIDLMDGGPNLLDLRFADDIIICARSRHELGQLVDSLTIHLEQVGLLLNADKTVVLTNEAQPPPILATDGGLKFAILQRNVGQKWLGCMLAAEGSQSQHLDLEYHLQQASKSFYANRWILLDRSVSISKRLKYFNAVVSSVACFGSGHRAIYSSQLATLDVHFRKLCRSIVGPPSEVDWNAAWNEILHLWNERTRSFVANAHVNTWSYITCKNYWNLAKHVASLPEHRWVQRLLSWHPFGTRRVGRPRNTWDSKLDAYCRYANLGYWRDAALDNTLWNSHLGSFVDFCRM